MKKVVLALVISVAGLVEVIRSEQDWRRARKAASNANAYI
jgi:hypothetical protein